MSRIYSYPVQGSNDLPIIKTYNDSCEFVCNLMKKSGNVNGCNIYYNEIMQIKKEIETKKSFNLEQQAEFLKYKFPEDKSVYHNGYIEYLMAAWYNDCGIEISPWYIWNVILHQLCQIVNNDPEKYRHIFTKSGGQIQITLYDEFNIHEFINQVGKHISFNINEFLPNFDNAYIPINYKECMYGLFGEMVKNYYSCMVTSCGVPKVRIIGSKDEWNKIISTLNNINEMFASKSSRLPYITKCITTVTKFINNLENRDYWGKFFYIKNCGSGSQKEIGGHIMGLLSSDMILTSGFPEMISRYPFIDNTRAIPVNSFYISGMMYSSLDSEGILVPEYHYNISYLDNDICDLTEEDIIIRRKLLKGLKQFKHFNGVYDKYHIIIDKSTSISNEVMRFNKNYVNNIPNYDEFKDSRVRKCYMELSEDNELRIKKDYSHMTKCIKLYNNLCHGSGSNQSEFLKLENEIRHNKLRSKYTVWINDRHDISRDKFDKNKLYFNKMDFNRWISSIKNNFELFDSIRENVPELLDYMIKNRNHNIYENLMTTLNLDVYEAMLNYQKMKQFDMPKTNAYSYHYLDPIIDYEKIGDLHFRFYLRMLMWLICSNRIDNNIKIKIIGKLIQSRPLYNEYITDTIITMINNRIKAIMSTNTLDTIKDVLKYDTMREVPFGYQSLWNDVSRAKFYMELIDDNDCRMKYKSYINKYIN